MTEKEIAEISNAYFTLFATYITVSPFLDLLAKLSEKKDNPEQILKDILDEITTLMFITVHATLDKPHAEEHDVNFYPLIKALETNNTDDFKKICINVRARIQNHVSRAIIKMKGISPN